MAGPFLAGVDVGTTSVKAALFDAGGALLAQRSSLIATQRPGPGLVEQAPDDWMSATFAGLQGVLDGVPLDAVEGIGLCSQVNTHVFVDANGKALSPAIIWQDGRCAKDAAMLDRLVSGEARLKWWGAPLPIDSSHALSRMAWMARAYPEIWRRTRWVMAPKDYCLLALTGEACADPLSSFGVVDSSLRYIDELIDLVPGAAERLPPLLRPSATAGRIRPGLPGAGRPIATATMDAWAGMLGAGAVRQGDAG
jgi:xylulokinase